MTTVYSDLVDEVSRVVHVRGMLVEDSAAAVFRHVHHLRRLRDDYLAECKRCGIDGDVEALARDAGADSFSHLMRMAATVGDYAGSKYGYQTGDTFKAKGRMIEGTPLLNRLRPAARRREGFLKALRRHFGAWADIHDYVLPTERVTK